MKKKYVLFVLFLIVTVAIKVKAQQSQMFEYVAESSLITVNAAKIENSTLDNKPNEKPIVTHRLTNPDGDQIYLDHKLTMWYGATAWRILYEDETDFEKNTAFNVFVPGDDTKSWVHKTESANISVNQSELDDPMINGDPDALVFIMGVFGEYDTNIVGVFYSNGSQKWKIFNQEGVSTDMAKNLKFHVVIAKDSNTSYSTMVHKTTPGNTSTFRTTLNHPDLNNNPNATLIITQVYNPGGASGGKYNNHNVGVRFDGSSWIIYNEDKEPFDAGCGFNVLFYANKPTGIIENKENLIDVKLFPNPANTSSNVFLTLDPTVSGEVNLKLMSLSGVNIINYSFNKATGETQHEIKLPKIAQGVYILEIENNGKIGAQKLIIQ